MNTAIFKNTKNGLELLCSECGICIRKEKDFDIATKFAADGTVTLLPQYCEKHKDLELFGVKRDFLRREIKERLREGLMKKNILGVVITKPNQKLIIMRGISGSGKSTKAKTLVGEGIIHSTDSLIEESGDYFEFFKIMNETKDFTKLSKMHHQNFLNVKKSMELGITPIILDNTNIKANEPKNVVKEALRLGYDDKNIIIIDVGDGGLSKEELAERNTHGVPLDKITKMLASYKGVGPLTVKKIIESKDMYGVKERVLYSAVVLDEQSKNKLINSVVIPDGWKIYSHHMTITFGCGVDDKNELGKRVYLKATDIGYDNLVMAVKVMGYPSNNDIPHVTVAVNVIEGGKPVLSNNLTNWVPLDKPIYLSGIVTDIKS